MNKIAVFVVGILIFLDSAISQNLVKKELCEAPKTRPLRGAKNRNQASSSASADFLLEAEKRGSPPKSEKRQLLARRGSGAGGAALLRKESSENNGNEITESIRDSSPTAQNDNFSVRVAESSVDSANLNEFIISYRAIMKNNALIGEKFSVSKALVVTPNPRIIAQCDIESNALDSNLAILKQNQSTILECFERELSTKIRDDVKSINNEVRTKTTYKIPAQRILLDRQRLKIHIIGQK